MVSIKTGLTLGLIGAGALSFYALVGAKGIGSRIGGGFTGFGQSDSVNAIAANATFQGVTFNTIAFDTDVNTTKVIDEDGTLLTQHIPGAVEFGAKCVGCGGRAYRGGDDLHSV